ncbi:DUF2375 family protein [Shewanella sp. MBTL60-007]|uniref:DUF2375 family protein n=1 Tax=Shewanella sp. MBTL60-007 TaxID=2815911 RepID=UPI001BC15DEA|nr:DUF2375 family protein [Shewanella sp. MBTL60-007]GIU31466.1 hypothetical protein TUM3792_43210 [Shewanella sp. MBTL60-007]
MTTLENIAITVLFYRENGSFELESAVIKSPKVSDKGRIIIPDDFRPGRCIFAVLMGRTTILNGIGATRSTKVICGPVTATVLYYSEELSLVLEASTLSGLDTGNQGRVLLDNEFRTGKNIICIVEGQVQLINYMGQRALTSQSNKNRCIHTPEG